MSKSSVPCGPAIKRGRTGEPEQLPSSPLRSLKGITDEILDAEPITPYRIYYRRGSFLVTPGRQGSKIKELDR